MRPRRTLRQTAALVVESHTAVRSTQKVPFLANNKAMIDRNVRVYYCPDSQESFYSFILYIFVFSLQPVRCIVIALLIIAVVGLQQGASVDMPVEWTQLAAKAESESGKTFVSVPMSLEGNSAGPSVRVTAVPPHVHSLLEQEVMGHQSISQSSTSILSCTYTFSTRIIVSVFII
jgi:hypothetical protein